MVDLTGKFYLLDELDERFVKECVDVDAYKEYQGRWVKNAYDPQFTVNGKYDGKSRSGRRDSRHIYMYDDEGCQPGIQDREARAQLSALLAYGQTGAVLPVG